MHGCLKCICPYNIVTVEESPTSFLFEAGESKLARIIPENVRDIGIDFR